MDEFTGQCLGFEGQVVQDEGIGRVGLYLLGRIQGALSYQLGDPASLCWIGATELRTLGPADGSGAGPTSATAARVLT